MSIEETTSPDPTLEVKTPVVHARPPLGRVAVVTDSVAQVPPEIAARWGITVVPLTITIGEQKYLDGVDLVSAELYRRMRVENALPTTSAPSLGEYLATFRACLSTGAQAVLYVSLSCKLSMGYRVACQAAEMVRAEFPDRAVKVFDSRQVTISEGFIAMAAARAAAEDKPLATVLERGRAAMAHVGFAATLETLQYLARGGRIGKAAHFLGSLINVKPILTVDTEGVVAPIGRVRGIDHALEAIVEYVLQCVDGCQTLWLAVMEADAPKEAARLRELALQRWRPAQIFFSNLTPVVGAHTGPGLVGLGYYYEP